MNSNDTDMTIAWRTLPFALMTATEYNRISQLRQDVFVVEQHCCYQDADDFDMLASHLLAESKDGRLVACCRLLPPHSRFAEPSIGRVCTDRQWRNRGIGHDMMERALTQLQHDYPQQAVRISAQQYLHDFYQQLGFEQASGLYHEDGIPHIEMLFTPKTLNPASALATGKSTT